MAEFRTIHSKMWRDNWFNELDVDGKLLWIYLITNQAASLTGIYYMPAKFAGFETGLGQERVETLLSQFVLAGKIEYENCVVWVKRMRRYQAQNESSPKIKPRIIKDLAEIPDCKIKRMYLELYPIDTVLIPTHTDTDIDTDTNTNTDSSRKRDPLFDAICAVCMIDPKVKGNGAKIGKVRAALSDSEPPYSANEIFAFGTWWNSDEWRSKKGPPTIWKLTEQIGIVRNGNGKAITHGTSRPSGPTIGADETPEERERNRQIQERIDKKAAERAARVKAASGRM